MRVRDCLLRTGSWRTGVLASLVALLVAVAPSWAVAAPSAYPPPPTGLEVSTSVATPGSTIGVTGFGCAPESTVTILLFSDPVVLGTTVANGQGQFAINVTIPLNTVLGQHRLVAKCGPLTLSAALTIVASTAAAPAAVPTPFTGWDTRAPLLAGLALLMLGSGAVLAARSRRLRRHT